VGFPKCGHKRNQEKVDIVMVCLNLL